MRQSLKTFLSPFAAISIMAASLCFPSPSFPAKGVNRDGASSPHRGSFETTSPGKPVIAIIIDDLGTEWRNTPEFFKIDGEITYSILPGYAYSEKARRFVRESGREMMIHIPMERRHGRRYRDDSHVLWQDMAPEFIKAVMARNMELFPEARGANNHMGSVFTTWKAGIKIVLEQLKERDLYFIDSVTGRSPKAYEQALEMGLRTYRRDIFLDYNNNVPYVERQLAKLIDIAKENGKALAIGHPRRATLAALSREIPRFRERGVRLAPVSAIVETKSADEPR